MSALTTIANNPKYSCFPSATYTSKNLFISYSVFLTHYNFKYP